MDSPTAIRPSTPSSGSAPGSTPGSNDDSQRVKFLCSFLGNIMPRPQDGKLRYVGGETRIVTVSRDIGYEELMSKMRELYDGAAVLKYQQPDEDLDALVSVVNDDDVINMMEEYDKLGSGDGFTRLRIFLFSQSEQDGSSHFIDGDDRDTERRYVDALNNLNDVSDFRKLQQPEFSMLGSVEDIHVADQFFNPISVDGGFHSQRSGEISMTHYNLHHPTIPHIGSGPLQQPMTQRYSEMDAPRSPAYYSPRHHGHHDSRSLVEFPTSPSSRYQMPFPELSDKCIDRMPEEYARHQVSHLPVYDNQPQYSDNVVWYPTGAASSEKSGFPGNIIHGPHVLDGNSICEHCRISFQRNQSHFDHPNISNGLPPVANPCAECHSNRDTFMMNADAKLHPVIYPNEPSNDHRSAYNDTQNHERGWVLQHQANNRVEEVRGRVSGSGRLNDHYVVDGTGINFSPGHGSVADGHHLNYVHQRAGPELGPELFHDQAVATTAHIQIPPPEERSMRYGNPPSYGVDSHYPVIRGHVPGPAFRRNSPTPVHIGPSYEASSPPRQVNGVVNTGIRGDGSPRIYIGPDSQNHWVDSPHKMSSHDGLAIPEYPYAHALKLNPKALGLENQHPVIVDKIHSPPSPDMNVGIHLEPVQLPKSSFTMVHNKDVSKNGTPTTKAMGLLSQSLLGGEKEADNVDQVENSQTQTQSISFSDQNKIAKNEGKAAAPVESNNSKSKPVVDCGNVAKPVDGGQSAPEEPQLSVNQFSFLPDLIASVKKAALEGAEEVKAGADQLTPSQIHNSVTNDKTANEGESAVRIMNLFSSI